MDRRTLLVTAGAGVVVVGAGGWWLLDRSGSNQTQLPVALGAQDTGAPPNFDLVPDMVIGDPDAPVEVIEYASLTCPHCANFHLSVFPRLRENYIDTGLVRFVHREVYFDRFALWGAMVARCGSDSRYFPMLDELYAHQQAWAGTSSESAAVEQLRAMGRRSGLSNEQIDACLGDADQAEAMVAVYQYWATEHQVNATPTFFIDGERYPNMPYEDFAAALDSRLEG